MFLVTKKQLIGGEWKGMCGINEMEEKWIKGFQNKYSVSDEGEVFSYISGSKKRLMPNKNQDGYLCVALGLGYKKTMKHYRIHRLVAEAFIENPDGKATVNHKDGIKANNNVANLEWNTHQENMEHAFENGLIPPPPCSRGELNGMAKLKEYQVKQVRFLLSKRDAYGINQTDIAKLFGVSFQQISKIKLGLRWKETV